MTSQDVATPPIMSLGDMSPDDLRRRLADAGLALIFESPPCVAFATPLRAAKPLSTQE